MPTVLKKEQLIFYLLVLTALTFTITGSIVFFSESSSCTMSDFNSNNPIEVTYKDFTQTKACQKALAMCRYFSKFPGKCVEAKGKT